MSHYVHCQTIFHPADRIAFWGCFIASGPVNTLPVHTVATRQHGLAISEKASKMSFIWLSWQCMLE